MRIDGEVVKRVVEFSDLIMRFWVENISDELTFASELLHRVCELCRVLI